MMAEVSSQTPVTSVKTPRAINTLLRSLLQGTPFRTPDRRRFGPTGSKTVSRARRRRSEDTPVNVRTSSQDRSQQGSAEVTSSPDIKTRSEEAEHNIKELWNKTWHTFRVTPLYNYKKKQSDFKYYSNALSSHIAAETKKGTFIDATLPGEATFGTISGFDTLDADEKAVLIEIQGQNRNSKDKSVISQCVLFSTDLEYNPLKPSIQDSFTYFPVMFVRGPEALSQTIQNWLEVQFDCRVIPMTFTSHELVFMAAMFTGFGEVHKPVELVYSVPTKVEGLSKIDYSTSAQDCIKLWNSVRSSEDDAFTSEEASLFISGLESHFYECFSIKLHAMPLSTIGTAIAFVGRDGKIKFYTKSTENTLKVLRHLTDLALDEIKVI